MTYDVSTSLPSTLPASAALARPGPIDAATSATEIGASNVLMAPSGNRMAGMAELLKTKSAGRPHFSSEARDDVACARSRLVDLRTRSRCHHPLLSRSAVVSIS